MSNANDSQSAASISDRLIDLYARRDEAIMREDWKSARALHSEISRATEQRRALTSRDQPIPKPSDTRIRRRKVVAPKTAKASTS